MTNYDSLLVTLLFLTGTTLVAFSSSINTTNDLPPLVYQPIQLYGLLGPGSAVSDECRTAYIREIRNLLTTVLRYINYQYVTDALDKLLWLACQTQLLLTDSLPAHGPSRYQFVNE